MLNHILYATQTYMSGQERRKQPGEMRVKKKCGCILEESEMDVWRVPTSVSKLLQVSGDTHSHSVDGEVKILL